MTIANAILIYEENGQVKHRFCPEAEAKEYLSSVSSEMKGATMFTAEGWASELVFSISPELRERVEEAKRKMRMQIRLRDALDRNGVPRDFNLRQSIFKAVDDLQLAA